MQPGHSSSISWRSCGVRVVGRRGDGRTDGAQGLLEVAARALSCFQVARLAEAPLGHGARCGLRYGTRLCFRDRSERIWPAESFALEPPRRMTPAVCGARRALSWPALGLCFRARARLRDAGYEWPRYVCGRGVSKTVLARLAPRASERAGYTGLSGLPCARASLFQTHPSHRVFVNTLPFWTLRWLFAFPSMLQDASSSFELTSG